MVRRVMRLQRSAALLAGALVWPLSVHACSCVDMTGSERYASFPKVFVGRVMSTSLATNPNKSTVLGREVVQATVVPTEVFKGSFARPYKVIGGAEYQATLCAVPLMAGAEYLFTVDESSEVSSCNTWFSDSPESKELLRTFRRLKAQGK